MERGNRYSQRPTDVYFYATCLVDLFCPEAGMDAITLLEREGITVHFPEDQTCCGQPAYTSGFAYEARAVALTQMRLFSEDWPVVIPSGSCAGIVRHHYPKLFADEPQLNAKAEALAERERMNTHAPCSHNCPMSTLPCSTMNPNAAVLAEPSRSSTRRFHRQWPATRQTRSRKPVPKLLFRPIAAA